MSFQKITLCYSASIATILIIEIPVDVAKPKATTADTKKAAYASPNRTMQESFNCYSLSLHHGITLLLNLIPLIDILSKKTMSSFWVLGWPMLGRALEFPLGLWWVVVEGSGLGL